MVEVTKIPTGLSGELKYKKDHWGKVSKNAQTKGANKPRASKKNSKISLPQLKFLSKDTNEH